MATYEKGRVTPIKRNRIFMFEQKQPDGSVLGSWVDHNGKGTRLAVQQFSPQRKPIGEPLYLEGDFLHRLFRPIRKKK